MISRAEFRLVAIPGSNFSSLYHVRDVYKTFAVRWVNSTASKRSDNESVSSESYLPKRARRPTEERAFATRITIVTTEVNFQSKRSYGLYY